MKGVAGVVSIVAVVVAVTVVAVKVTAASSAARLPVAYGFDGNSGWKHGQVRPHGIEFGAGGNLLVRGLKWISWTSNFALARGVRWFNRCVPTCAAGKYQKVPAEMSLSRVWQRDGVSYFSRMILQWKVGSRHYMSAFVWSHGPYPAVLPFWS